MDLLDLEHLLSNVSFACLLSMVVWYWFKLSFSIGHQFSRIGRFGMALANTSLAGVLTIRWVVSGHFPLSNLYESLLFLSWGLTAFHLVVEGLGEVDLIGVVTSPVALLVNAFASFSLPRGMQKATALIPALQSNWLMMHVTVMMLSYAALISGSLLSIGLLVVTNYSRKVPKELELEAVNGGPIDGCQEATNHSQPVHRVSMPERGGGGGERPHQGLTNSLVQKVSNTETFNEAPELVASYQGHVHALETSQEGSRGNTAPNQAELLGERALLTNPRLTSHTFSFTHPSVDLSRDLSVLTQTLDNLSYRALGLGFPLLTIGILSGAVWANEAWGSYWSWDPKETWALITWLVFAIYLHTRLNKGWRGSKPALIAATGFVVVWICYLGVNMLGTGLHSYGWFRGTDR